MEEKKTKTELEPFQKEENWLPISITLAIIALVLGCLGLVWIFDLGPLTSVDDRIKVASLIGTALLAFITYSTVIWRGLVGLRQANEQKRANDAKDDENTARLMLDGSKMVGDEKNFSVLAGISALELVMSTPDSKFSQTAADVLADYIRTNIDNETRDTVGQRARIALEKGAEIGLPVDRKLNVYHRSKEFDQTIKPYNGFKSVSYFGGEISETEFEKIRKPDRTSFNATTLKSFTQFDITDRFTDCTFMFCSLKSVVMDDQESHRFSRCDFSSTHITLTNPIPREELVNMKEKFTQCTYRSDSPPTGDVVDDFLVYMEPIPSPP